jgi:hypothetical protein
MNALGIAPAVVEKGIELGFKIGNKIKEVESAQFDNEYAQRYYEIYGKYPDASMYQSGHRGSGVVGSYDNTKLITTSYNNATKVENLNATINSREKTTANNKVLTIALIAIVIGGGLILLTK